ncbi:MAG: hypothetical protein AAB842_01075 [Patescibacteria group bacterium]
MEKVSRRNFIKNGLGAIGTVALIGNLEGCLDINGPPAPEVLLTGNPEIDAESIKGIYKRIEQIVKDPLDKLRIGWLEDNNKVKVVVLSYLQDAKGDKRAVITNEETGESSYLGFGIKGLSPSIKFMSEKGKTLLDEAGKEMEYAFLDFNKKGAPAKNFGVTDWLVLAIKAVAIGFAIWLGAKIIALIVGAVAFVAFNVMVIGLVIAGVVALGAVAKWVIDKTGWNYETAKDFFGKTVEDIKLMFQDVASAVGG